MRIEEYVWVLDPAEPMLGPTESGTRIVAVTRLAGRYLGGLERESDLQP